MKAIKRITLSQRITSFYPELHQVLSGNAALKIEYIQLNGYGWAMVGSPQSIMVINGILVLRLLVLRFFKYSMASPFGIPKGCKKRTA